MYSCKKEENPDPFQSSIFKQQAPFGLPATDTQLSKVLYDDQLLVTYFYKDGQLAEHKSYTPLATPLLYATGSLERSGKLVTSYEVQRLATFKSDPPVPEYFYPKFISTFLTPVSDSVRTVHLQMTPGQNERFTDYFFDKAGYVVREETYGPAGAASQSRTLHTRNAAHDITGSRMFLAGNPVPHVVYEVQYDNHPNPFFFLGMNQEGTIGLQSLSPHNITKMTLKFKDGNQYDIHYRYEYLPNGYPKTVMINNEGIANSAFTLTFDY